MQNFKIGLTLYLLAEELAYRYLCTDWTLFINLVCLFYFLFFQEGDMLVYRLVELSSSWCPEISPFRVSFFIKYPSKLLTHTWGNSFCHPWLSANKLTNNIGKNLGKVSFRALDFYPRSEWHNSNTIPCQCLTCFGDEF